MNKTTKQFSAMYFVVLLFMWLMVYGAFAFAYWQINAAFWDEKGRQFCALLMICACGFSAVVCKLIKGEM